MTGMRKMKRAQRKASKCKVKGKAKAKENGRHLKMCTVYFRKQSAPISVPKTTGKQSSTKMPKKQACLADQFCKL